MTKVCDVGSSGGMVSGRDDDGGDNDDDDVICFADRLLLDIDVVNIRMEKMVYYAT